MGFAGNLFGNKHLRPVIAPGNITDTDSGVVRVQNIGAMSGGIHPAVYNCLRRCVTLGDVLTGTSVGDAEVFDHLEGGAVNRAGVGEVFVVLHVLRLVAGDPAQFPIVSKGLQSVFRPDLIDQTDDLLLVAGNPSVHSGDVDFLARVDQVQVLDLGIGAFDLAQTYLIFGCDLPYAFAGDYGVGDRGGRYLDQKYRNKQKGAEDHRKQLFHIGYFSLSQNKKTIPQKAGSQKSGLAAETAQLAENLPDSVTIGVAIGVAAKEEHLADLLFRILSREDRMDCNRFVMKMQAVNVSRIHRKGHHAIETCV